MGKAIPAQHPAVVLRSHFKLVRALLAVAMIAIVGLTIAVVIVANDTEQVSSTSVAKPGESIRYGDFNPATGRPDSAPLPHQGRVAPPPNTRYDGGPEEGSADVSPPRSQATQSQAFPGLASEANGPQADVSPSQAGTKDYSMNGATGDYAAPSEAKAGVRPDGGPEEGSRGPGH